MVGREPPSREHAPALRPGVCAFCGFWLRPEPRRRPTPTPTPRPKLSGGFGRPRATPVASAVSEGGQSLADVVRARRYPERRLPGKEKSGITIDNKTLVKDTGKGKLTTSSMGAARPCSGADSVAGGPRAPAVADATASVGIRRRQPRGRRRGRVARDRPPRTETGRGREDPHRRSDGDRPESSRTTSTRGTTASTATASSSRRGTARRRSSSRPNRARAAEKQLADLPERARRAGALPGWIRE